MECISNQNVAALTNAIETNALLIQCTPIFYPLGIRSEAEKKKYATIEEMLSTFFGAPPVDEPNENDRVAMAELYDAIKSGKIVID
ncbi:TPA: hypothetical protein O8L39_004443 [Enterobacter kobei]|nr:hypothetical protein [Enterobacter kobei]